MRNSRAANKKPPMLRIPRCISSTSVWWIQATSMKHTSPWSPGRYGESSKPMMVPQKTKDHDPDSHRTTCRECSCLCQIPQGHGQDVCQPQQKGHQHSWTSRGSFEVWDTFLSLEHDNQGGNRFCWHSSANCAHVFPHLSYVLYTRRWSLAQVNPSTQYLFKSSHLVKRDQSQNYPKNIKQQLQCPRCLFSVNIFVRSRYPRTNIPRARSQPLCISNDRTFDQPLHDQVCEIKISLVGVDGSTNIQKQHIKGG